MVKQQLCTAMLRHQVSLLPYYPRPCCSGHYSDDPGTDLWHFQECRLPRR